MRLTIYREILPYVPRFRDKLFVIALDGAVDEDDNFRNLLRDISLLRSLSIKVALVHGAAHQIRRLAEMMNVTPSNLDGSGVTDQATLRLALLASSRVSWEMLEGLSAADLRGAVGNALVAHPAGILQGIDHQYTGKVERVDAGLLQALLERDVVPVVPPIGSDGEGNSYRLNSDAVAVEVARTLGAVKLIYLTTHPGLPIPGEAGAVYRHLKDGEADHVLKRHGAEYPPELRSKLEQAIKAVRSGVPRVHLIDGRVEEGLLGEVFSNEGIGTLIHTSEYQEIRGATKRDVRALHALMQSAVDDDELVPRTRAEVERQIDDYFIFEVDKTPAGCVSLHVYPDEEMGEMAAVRVDPRFQNQGIATKLMRYVEERAKAKGLKTLFCLSTQAFNFFRQKGGFTPGTPDDLPPARRGRYEQSGRRSMVLLKRLG